MNETYLCCRLSWATKQPSGWAGRSSVLETADPETDFVSATDFAVWPWANSSPLSGSVSLSEVNMWDVISGFQACCHQSHLESLKKNIDLGAPPPPQCRALEEEMETHSSILAWKIPWIEEPVGYSPWDRNKWLSMHTHFSLCICFSLRWHVASFEASVCRSVKWGW